MKKLRISVIIGLCVFIGGLSACGKKEENTSIESNPGYIEITKNPTSSSNKFDRWDEKSSETVESTEESATKSTIESTVEPTTEPSIEPIVESSVESTEETIMVSEEDLLHVEMSDSYKAVIEHSCSLADYSLDDIVDVQVRDDIDYRITLDSDTVRKFISKIYNDTGCTSHTIVEEYYPIFEDDPYDYTVSVLLDNGNTYYIALIGEYAYVVKGE